MCVWICSETRLDYDAMTAREPKHAEGQKLRFIGLGVLSNEHRKICKQIRIQTLHSEGLLGDQKESISSGMPHSLDDFATDDAFGFDFDAFMRGPPDVEAMTEACVSGDLIAVQSVFKTRWLDKTVDERLDRDMFGAGGLCEAIKQDDVNLVQFLLSNVVSMQSCHFRLATEYHAYSTLQLYLDRGFDINTHMSRIDPPALS